MMTFFRYEKGEGTLVQDDLETLNHEKYDHPDLLSDEPKKLGRF